MLFKLGCEETNLSLVELLEDFCLIGSPWSRFSGCAVSAQGLTNTPTVWTNGLCEGAAVAGPFYQGH